MSSVPSYLCTTTGKEISTKIFLDLQLDSLLSPAAQKILSYPLDKEGIALIFANTLSIISNVLYCNCYNLILCHLLNPLLILILYK